MKTSELIETLQYSLKKHGDLQVCVLNNQEYPDAVTTVELYPYKGDFYPSSGLDPDSPALSITSY